MYRANVKVTSHVTNSFLKARLRISERGRVQVWMRRQLERIGPSQPHTTSTATESLTPSWRSSFSTAPTAGSVPWRDSHAIVLHGPELPMLVFYLESDESHELSFMTIKSNSRVLLPSNSTLIFPSGQRNSSQYSGLRMPPKTSNMHSHHYRKLERPSCATRGTQQK